MSILVAGGGTGGHVVPNIALIEDLRKHHPRIPIHYIGEKNGIEARLIKDIPFHAIPAGKLRRYFSWQNFIDVFKVGAGILKSLYLIIKIRPKVVFCKGGYVTLPVGIAAFILRKKLIIHDSDSTPGLTTRILSRFADHICLGFAETKENLAHVEKVVFTGSPVRSSIFEGSRKKGFKLLGWKEEGKPVLLIMGGSSGASSLNNGVSEILDDLLSVFRVVHITGKGKKTDIDHSYDYQQYEYLGSELADVYAMTDLAISRAGAGAIAELVQLKIPSVLIPLPAAASRGDQIENAEILVRNNAAILFDQQESKWPELKQMVLELANSHTKMQELKDGCQKYAQKQGNPIKKINDLILQCHKSA